MNQTKWSEHDIHQMSIGRTMQCECTKCQFKWHTPEAIFCSKCGTKLEIGKAAFTRLSQLS